VRRRKLGVKTHSWNVEKILLIIVFWNIVEGLKRNRKVSRDMMRLVDRN
jgi:hypothetical protein